MKIYTKCSTHCIPQALDIQNNDKSCLVARSKCYLQLGNAEAALQDAEASLKDDKNYHRVRFKENSNSS